jgi:hypothetical protein
LDFSTRVLGTHIATQLHTAQRYAVLTIGRDVFTRRDLAAVACFNYVAALNLSRALKDLDVKSTKDVFDRISPIDLAVPHVGAVALAVLGAAFEAKGLGNGTPLESWVQRHRHPDTRKEIVAFGTIKHRVADALADRQAKRRKRNKGGTLA